MFGAGPRAGSALFFARVPGPHEAPGPASVLGRGTGPYRVATVWIVRPSAANRRLVARYPEVFASACPGSSRAWLRALAEGASPPAAAGLVCCDPVAGRLTEWRRRRPGPQIGASMTRGSPNFVKS